MSQSHSTPILGIDLGTTKAMACIVLEGDDRPTIIRPDPRGPADWMPSAFCMTEDGPVVGEEARHLLYAPKYQDSAVRCAKRYMHVQGRLFPRHDPQFRALDVSAYILRRLRERAEGQLGLSPGSITEAVVAVPACFGQIERRQTRLAARDAGFDPETVSLVDEPIAAAIGLGLDRAPGERLVMLIDLGGGKLDVSLLCVGAAVGGCGLMELGRDGHNALGGLNWDEEIAKMAVVQHDLDPEVLTPDNTALFGPAEEIKISFCTSTPPGERLLSFYERSSRKQLDTLIKRADFVRTTRPLAERCGKICDRLLQGIQESDLAALRRKRKGWGGLLAPRRLRKIGWADLDDVVMVGGGSQVDAVQEVIRQRWGRPPTVAAKPQHQVAFGAALSARRHFEGSPLRSPHSIGCWCYPQGHDGPRVFNPVIRRNQRIGEESGVHFRCPVGGKGSVLSVELVEERLDPNDQQAAEYLELGTIRLADFAQAPLRQTEHVGLLLRCPSDREMQVTAEFRGRARTVNVSQRGDLEPAEGELVALGSVAPFEPAVGPPEEETERSPAAEEPAQPSEPSGAAPTAVWDRDLKRVQFTVYRPRVVVPERPYRLLAFAHLADLPPDSDRPHPLDEVRRMASRILGRSESSYQHTHQDASQAVPEGSQVTFHPWMGEEIRFDPPYRTFTWWGEVERAKFTLTAASTMEGKVAEGAMSVFVGAILLAEVPLAFAVRSNTPTPEDAEDEPVRARRFGRVFVSYSHLDEAVVQQFQECARAIGHDVLVDRTSLDAGDDWDARLLQLIRRSNVFQLFWSRNSMYSPNVQREWEYALSLNRPRFVRPVHWENPIPSDKAKGLPPAELRRLHFQWLSVTESPSPHFSPAPKPGQHEEGETRRAADVSAVGSSLRERAGPAARQQDPRTAARQRRKMLIAPTAVLIALVALGTVMWVKDYRARRGEIAMATAQLEQWIRQGEFEKAEQCVKQLESSRPRVAASPEVMALARTIEPRARDERLQREQFEQTVAERLTDAVGDLSRFMSLLDEYVGRIPDTERARDFRRVLGDMTVWKGMEEWNQFLVGWQKADRARLSSAEARSILATASDLPSFPQRHEFFGSVIPHLRAIAQRRPGGEPGFAEGLHGTFTRPLVQRSWLVIDSIGLKYYSPDKIQLPSGPTTEVKFRYFAAENPFTWQIGTSVKSVAVAPQSVLAQSVIPMLEALTDSNWEQTHFKVIEAIVARQDVDPILRAELLQRTLECGARGSYAFRLGFQPFIELFLTARLDLSVSWMLPEDGKANRVRLEAQRVLERLPDLATAGRISAARLEEFRTRPFPTLVWIGWLAREASDRAKLRCAGPAIATASGLIVTLRRTDQNAARYQPVGRLVQGRLTLEPSSPHLLDLLAEGTPLYLQSGGSHDAARDGRP